MKYNSYRLVLLVIISATVSYLLACNYIISKGSGSIRSKTVNRIDTKDTLLCSVPSFSHYIKLPGHLKGYFDYNEGLECSRQKGKPLLIFFSKIGSIKALKMEADVLIDTEVSKIIMENFILTVLCNDDVLKLPLKYQEYSLLTGDTIKTLGKKNEYYQMIKFKQNIQPAFYIINSKEELLVKPYYYSLSKKSFKKFLLSGIDRYVSSSIKIDK